MQIWVQEITLKTLSIIHTFLPYCVFNQFQKIKKKGRNSVKMHRY